MAPPKERMVTKLLTVAAIIISLAVTYRHLSGGLFISLPKPFLLADSSLYQTPLIPTNASPSEPVATGFLRPADFTTQLDSHTGSLQDAFCTSTGQKSFDNA